MTTIPDGYEVRTILVPTAESGLLMVIVNGAQTIYNAGHGPLCPQCGHELTAVDFVEAGDGVLAADATDGGDW
jgi:hypothetical protein